MKELLSIRKEIKRKKPYFVMQDAHKKIRLKEKWRKPRGIDSKMRLRLKGYNKYLQVGYGSPKLVRGLTADGLRPVIVYNVNGLKSIDKEKEGIIISSAVGDKKRIEIIKKVEEQGIRIVNIKNPIKYLETIEEERKKKVDEKASREKKKAEKKEREKKEKKKAEKKEDELADRVMTEEEKALQEKKEKDKLLIKREI